MGPLTPPAKVRPVLRAVVRASIYCALAGVTACSGSTAPPVPTSEPEMAPVAAFQPSAAPPSPGVPTVTPLATLAVTAPVTFDPASVVLSLERVGGGFIHPLFVTHAGDGSGRVFIVEKVGRVRLLNGSVVLDIRDRVLSGDLGPYEEEQGLLGLAFHPKYPTNGYVYLHYIDRRGGHVLSRFSMPASGLIDPLGEKVLFTLPQPEPTFDGGMVVFGPDGYLYLGLGTGGIPTDRQFLAQDLGSLFGKILRIDVDHGDPYSIPEDNPFVQHTGARPEIWAYGVRNPYRFSFDRANGDLYVGGPGHATREWVNYVPAGLRAGQNLGWPILEGTLCWGVPTCDRRGLLLPILEYEHTGGNCVIIGGYTYRGPSSPSLRGAYFYGDFCSGRIWAAARNAAGTWSTSEMTRMAGMIGSFGEDERGDLYVTDIKNGVVYRLVGTARRA